jgi:hypothetical protein
MNVLSCDMAPQKSGSSVVTDLSHNLLFLPLSKQNTAHLREHGAATHAIACNFDLHFCPTILDDLGSLGLSPISEPVSELKQLPTPMASKEPLPHSMDSGKRSESESLDCHLIKSIGAHNVGLGLPGITARKFILHEVVSMAAD